MQLFDIGVNLTNPRLQRDLAGVLARAQQAGVEKIMITGTSEADSAEAIALCQRFPAQCVATAGVHPHYSKDASRDVAEQLRKMSQSPCVKAIGECGLDFNRNFSPKADQLRVFELQLEIAAERGLPVFLHERDAFTEQVDLISRYRQQLSAGVAHCFTGDEAQMQSYLDHDLYIGITGWLCDEKRGTRLRQAVKGLPLSRLLLETDAPYLTPRNLRPAPKMNEPALLPSVLQTLAEITQTDPETLAAASWDNAQRLFG